MELTDFIKNFAAQFDETPMDLFTPKAVIKSLMNGIR